MLRIPSLIVGFLLLVWHPVLANQDKKSDLQIEKALQNTAELIESERLEEALLVLKSIDTNEASVRAKIDILLGNLYLRFDKPAKAQEFFEHASFNTMDDGKAIGI